MAGTEATGQFPRNPIARLGHAIHETAVGIGHAFEKHPLRIALASTFTILGIGAALNLQRVFGPSEVVDNAPITDTLKPSTDSGPAISIVPPPSSAEAAPSTPPDPNPPAPGSNNQVREIAPSPEQVKYVISSPVPEEDKKDLHLVQTDGTPPFTSYALITDKEDPIPVIACMDAQLQVGRAGRDNQNINLLTLFTSDGRQIRYFYAGSIANDSALPYSVKAGQVIGTIEGSLPPAFTKPELNKGGKRDRLGIDFRGPGKTPLNAGEFGFR